MVRSLLLVSALVLGASQAWAEGVFMVVKGDIKVEKDGKQVPAKVGMKVVEADTVIAGKDARAKIVMKDKNVLNISPESKIIIEKYQAAGEGGDKNVTLNVLYGKVRATVNQKYDGEKSKFHVKTPSAVAGVRGTDFITGYKIETKQAEFVTFEGKVEVGQMGAGGTITNSVFVNPGEMTTSIAGAVPNPPSEVPKQELAKMDGGSKSDNKNDRQPASDSGAKQEGQKQEGEKKQDKQEKQDAKQEPKGDQASTDKKQEPASGEGDKKGGDKQAGGSAPKGPAGAPSPGNGGDGKSERAPASTGPVAGPNGAGPSGSPGGGSGGCMFCDVGGGPIGGGPDVNSMPKGPEFVNIMPERPNIPNLNDIPRAPADFVQKTRLLINVIVQQ